MKAYIHTKEKSNNPNQIGGYHSYCTIEVEIKETKYLPRKGQTISGYGSAMPTNYMIKFNNRWQRVKAICFSNCSTLYIGKKYTECLTVNIER
jgi:uncharacterized protein (DUF1330 family)